MRQLSVVMFGELPESSLAALRAAAPGFELIGRPPETSFRDSSAKQSLHATCASASNDWILLVREGEFVLPELAGEIAFAVERESAWGYRIRRRALYRRRALALLSDNEGEVRLFHRRHVRFETATAGEMRVEGSVVRLSSQLEYDTWLSVAEHRSSVGERHSFPRHLLRFAKAALSDARRIRGTNDLLFLWNESARSVPGSTTPAS